MRDLLPHRVNLIKGLATHVILPCACYKPSLENPPLVTTTRGTLPSWKSWAQVSLMGL